MVKVSESNKDILTWTKGVCGVLTFLSGVIALILVTVVSSTKQTFELPLDINRSIRNSTMLGMDGYPEIDTKTFGTARVGMTAAFTGILAGIAYLVVALLRNSEVEQMNGGSNPYVWIFNLIWNVPYFLIISFVAGVSDAFTLTLISLAVFSWLFIFWLDDLMNSYAWRAAKERYMGGQNTYSWIPVVMVLFVAVATLVVIFVHVGFTFSSIAAPAGITITIPIVLAVLYLITPIVYILHRYKTGVTDIFVREMVIYIASGVMVLAAVWLTLLILNADNVAVAFPAHTPSSAASSTATPLTALAGTALAALAMRA